MKTLALAALIVLVAMSGCIQNIADLKDRLGAGADEPLQETAVIETTPTPVPVANKTPLKAPVARISVFADSGALLFKSSFQADNVTEVIFVEEKAKLNLIGGDSEAIEKGATIARYAWTLDGKAAGDQKQATIEVGEAGIYVVALTVTDSQGSADTQTIELGVAPKPFDVVTELSAAAIPGALGQPAGTTLAFDLKLADAKVPATIVSAVFAASPDATCDVAMEILDAAGESLGEANGSDATTSSQAESVTLEAPAEGAYTISLTPEACVSQSAIPVTVTVTYLPVIEGAAGGEHGGH